MASSGSLTSEPVLRSDSDYILMRPATYTAGMTPAGDSAASMASLASVGSEVGRRLRRASMAAAAATQAVAAHTVEHAKKPISWFWIGCVVAAFIFGFFTGGASGYAVFSGSDFVCHDGETNVDLDTACERIREYEGSAGARRRRGLTSVPTAYSCLPHYRIPVTGTNGLVTFPYHASSDMMQPEIGKHTLAIIVLHGALRDADTYFCMMRNLKFSQKERDPNRIIVITPDFNYRDDPGVQEGDAWWNHSKPWGDWRAGAHSDGASGRGQTVSSFQVLDTFLQLLSDPVRFPNVDKITMVGHSAGGQSVQRYAFSTLLPTSLRPGLTVRFIVANPSSYAYLDARRPKYRCGVCECNDNECDCSAGRHEVLAAAAEGEACPVAEANGGADFSAIPFVRPPVIGFDRTDAKGFVCGTRTFNDWPYGLSNLGHYAALQPLNRSLDRFPSRDVVYLVGQNDTCNDGLPVCNADCWQRDNGCFRNEMDTRCPAMLEGPWRKLRAHLYMRYLNHFYGRATHHLDEIPGVGHNASAMFEAPVALGHIFRVHNDSLRRSSWPSPAAANVDDEASPSQPQVGPGWLAGLLGR